MNEQHPCIGCTGHFPDCRNHCADLDLHHAAVDGEDFEAAIAKEFSAPIDAHAWIDVEGFRINCKHHMGGSALPHTRMTGLGREAVQDMLWEDLGGSPGTDVLVRSHVHYHVDGGGADFPRMMTTPALQGPGSRYGVRRCSGTVHFGMVVVDCKDGKFNWRPVLAKIEAGSPTLRVVR